MVRQQPWTDALLKVLDDGEWHDYQDVLREVCPSVPAEKAFQKAEYYRHYHYLKQGKEPPQHDDGSPKRRYGDQTNTIKTGQKFIISRAIQNLCRRGVVEVETVMKTGGKRSRPISIRLARKEQ